MIRPNLIPSFFCYYSAPEKIICIQIPISSVVEPVRYLSAPAPGQWTNLRPPTTPFSCVQNSKVPHFYRHDEKEGKLIFIPMKPNKFGYRY